MNNCVIDINGKEYTLALTRNSVKAMEAAGFDVQSFMQKPITMMDIVWFGGFVKNYPELTITQTSSLLEEYQNEGGDVNEVVTFLVEEYSAFVNAPADTKSKKKATFNKAK